VSEQPDPPECPDDEHEWEHYEDSDGDPGVINGTRSWCYLECAKCGKQTDCDGRHDDPDDYL